MSAAQLLVDPSRGFKVVLRGTSSFPCTQWETLLKKPHGLKEENWAPRVFLPCFPFYIIRNLRLCFSYTALVIIVSCKGCAHRRCGDDRLSCLPQFLLQTISTGFWSVIQKWIFSLRIQKFLTLKYPTLLLNKIKCSEDLKKKKALYLECEIINR